jgi:hypothetical protein
MNVPHYYFATLERHCTKALQQRFQKCSYATTVFCGRKSMSRHGTNEKIKLCCDMYSLLNEYKELEETFRWYQFSHREPVTK